MAALRGFLYRSELVRQLRTSSCQCLGMEKYYITRYYLSLAVFIHLNYKIRKYCQPSFGYSWHKHTNTHAHTRRTNPKNPKLQACFIFQLVKDHGNLTLAASCGVWCLVQVTCGWLGASLTGWPSPKKA